MSDGTVNVELFPELVRPVPPSDTPHWFTPLKWFLAFEASLLARELIPRAFDFDPFAHPLAPVTREILRRGGQVYYGRGTITGDSLDRPWRGRVGFCNPGYDAELLNAVAPKLVAEAPFCHLGGLLPAWTDRLWYHRSGLERLRKADICEVDFLQGRLAFGWPDNPDASGDVDQGTFPLMTVAFRPWRVGEISAVLGTGAA